MKKHFYGKTFRFARFVSRIFYHKYNVTLPDLKDEPVVFVSHHQNFFGPVVAMLWLPINVHIWVLHVFFHYETAFKQLSDYTFTQRFGMHPIMANLLSKPLAFVLSTFYQSANAIPVYRNSKKIIHTFKDSVRFLSKGEPLLIFPDVEYGDSSTDTKDLYSGYLFVDKYYFKETGKHVQFIPLYVSKKSRTMTAGESISFRDDCDFKEELQVVNEKIMNGLNELAKS